MPKKHANFWLDIALRLKLLWCCIENVVSILLVIPLFATNVQM